MRKTISEFKGKYFFLSNYYTAPVEYDGILYLNNEAAFQAAKCLAVGERKRFAYLTPPDAKRLGRSVLLRKDWEQVKTQVMYEICLCKFTQNPQLAKMLLETGDAELIEGNTWGDRVWGVCKGEGENRLGKILMRVRAEIGGEMDG